MRFVVALYYLHVCMYAYTTYVHLPQSYYYVYVTVCGKTNLIPQTLILQYRAKRACNRYLVDIE